MSSTKDDSNHPKDASVDASTEVEEKQFSCVYFGFASNLSPRSLQQRCPGSLYVGLARLLGWRFIITETGFGNIVPGDSSDEVYGTLHFLTPQHEAALDKSEEVPWWHQKQTISVERVAVPFISPGASDTSGQGVQLKVTTYIDVERTTEGRISKEYIVLLRKAITDGVKCGVPQSYFQRYFQKFLPDDDSVGVEDKVMMLRTAQMNKENLSYVPNEMLRLVKKST